MSLAALTTSIQISEETSKLLDEAAKKTRLSRSFLVEEALKRHLPSTVGNDAPLPLEERLRRIRELGGIGVRLVGEQSVEDLERRSREFRGND